MWTHVLYLLDIIPGLCCKECENRTILHYVLYTPWLTITVDYLLCFIHSQWMYWPVCDLVGVIVFGYTSSLLRWRRVCIPTLRYDFCEDNTPQVGYTSLYISCSCALDDIDQQCFISLNAIFLRVDISMQGINVIVFLDYWMVIRNICVGSFKSH